MTAAYVLFGILIFGVLIAVHEFGHFLAAKLCGVKVNEFSVGMGPAIWKRQRGETLYALRGIPLGGYCAMEGEDGDSEDPRAFTSQNVWKRLLILCAGSFNNFLLGILIIFFLYLGAGAFLSPTIDSFLDGCPYEGADALQVGDRFVKINGKRVYQYYDVGDFLRDGDGVYDLVLIRDGKTVRLKDFEMTPRQYEGQDRELFGFNFGYEEATFPVKLRHTWNTAMEFGRMVWVSLRMLVNGEVGLKEMSGPVGIVELMAETGDNAESVSDGVFDILYLAAFIAINLAIMNMLPIPALDGGRVFLLLVSTVICAVTGKKMNPKYEGYIHAAGMVLLLTLMAVIMFQDIFKIFQ
ncbi:MAG: site-2 protease family protein [Oscillospiraceae bacterium]|nr:site-2 protease family protein [Oscillospiraceae bacterium]